MILDGRCRFLHVEVAGGVAPMPRITDGKPTADEPYAQSETVTLIILSPC